MTFYCTRNTNPFPFHYFLCKKWNCSFPCLPTHWQLVHLLLVSQNFVDISISLPSTLSLPEPLWVHVFEKLLYCHVPWEDSKNNHLFHLPSVNCHEVLKGNFKTKKCHQYNMAITSMGSGLRHCVWVKVLRLTRLFTNRTIHQFP